MDVETGLRRKELKGEWNRLDAYDLEFHQRVRRGYLNLVQLEPARWALIDASQEPGKVQETMRQVVAERLGISRSVAAN